MEATMLKKATLADMLRGQRTPPLLESILNVKFLGMDFRFNFVLAHIF
jgi:hypothetical protein